MKPHEETWKVYRGKGHLGSGTVVYVADQEGNPVLRATPIVAMSNLPWTQEAMEDPAYHEACAKLAAQAPRMARLLLKLEWADQGSGNSSCAICGGDPDYRGHGPDCELASVLRDAEVLP